MTESEWLTCTDPTPMLEFLRGKASDRKLRLFGCSCCRRVEHVLMQIKGACRAIDIAEVVADGGIVEENIDDYSHSIWSTAFSGPNLFGGVRSTEFRMSAGMAAACVLTGLSNFPLHNPKPPGPTLSELSNCCECCAAALAHCLRADDHDPMNHSVILTEMVEQAKLLRDIFGNPFRPVTIDPRWLTSNVVDLASVIYDERAFDRMPILADALTDAGCDDEGIIGHCRGDGPHVRGCHVIDALLGKS